MTPRLNRQEANMTKLTTRKSKSTKLTDTQLILLSRAAQREDGAATLPDGMTEKAAQKLAAMPVERGLFREIRAKPGMPVWGRCEEGRSHSLILAAAAAVADSRGTLNLARAQGDRADNRERLGAGPDDMPTEREKRDTPIQCGA
jgi:hypothetical protein